jgi:hypothetical protein
LQVHDPVLHSVQPFPLPLQHVWVPGHAWSGTPPGQHGSPTFPQWAHWEPSPTPRQTYPFGCVEPHQVPTEGHVWQAPSPPQRSAPEQPVGGGQHGWPSPPQEMQCCVPSHIIPAVHGVVLWQHGSPGCRPQLVHVPERQARSPVAHLAPVPQQGSPFAPHAAASQCPCGLQVSPGSHCPLQQVCPSAPHCATHFPPLQLSPWSVAQRTIPLQQSSPFSPQPVHLPCVHFSSLALQASYASTLVVQHGSPGSPQCLHTKLLHVQPPEASTLETSGAPSRPEASAAASGQSQPVLDGGAASPPSVAASPASGVDASAPLGAATHARLSPQTFPAQHGFPCVPQVL